MNIKCIVACYNSNGEPDFCFVKVKCNQEEYNFGDHYAAAKTFAFNHGYEGENGKAETMITFDNKSVATRHFLQNGFIWESASTVNIDGNEIKK